MHVILPLDSAYHPLLRVYLNLPISLFGIAASIINTIVFCHRVMRISLVNWFLLLLTISDLILIIGNLGFLVVPVLIYWPSAKVVPILTGMRVFPYLFM
jgi:hypothetical protein